MINISEVLKNILIELQSTSDDALHAQFEASKNGPVATMLLESEEFLDYVSGIFSSFLAIYKVSKYSVPLNIICREGSSELSKIAMSETGNDFFMLAA